MREIKFRGIPLGAKGFVYGGVWYQPDTERECSYICLLEQVEGVYKLTKTCVEIKSISQYTGLKDKNGVEIYEGDILDYTVFDMFDNDTQFKGVVNYVGSEFIVTQIPDSLNNGEYGLNLYWVQQQDCEIEIIGNIYQNPELIR